MKYIQYLIILAAAIPARAPVIDIRFNERNIPFVPNFIVPITDPPYSAVHNVSFDAILTLEYQSSVYFGTEDSRSFAILDESPIFQDAANYYSHDDPITRVFLGLGRGGYLMRTRGPISVLRNVSSNTGVLVLNDTDGVHFNRSCRAGTLSRIQYSHRRESSSTVCPLVELTHRVIWNRDDHSEGIVEAAETHLTSTNALADTLDSGIMSMPKPTADEIYRIIAGSGGVLDSRNSTVVNCNISSLIDQLPEIRLSFPRSGSEITLFPEDYVLLSGTEENKCLLNFHRQRIPWYFNPLALPNINVHITPNEFFVCDIPK